MFSTGGTWFQQLVQLGTLSRVDHVSIGLGDHLLHAHEKGVVLEPRAAWFGKPTQRWLGEYEILPDVSEGLASCLQRVGEPYDRVGIARVFLGHLWGRTLSAMTLDLSSASRAHTCSSLVLMLDPDGSKIPEWRDLASGSVVPVDLHRRLGASFRRIVHPLYAL